MQKELWKACVSIFLCIVFMEGTVLNGAKAWAAPSIEQMAGQMLMVGFREAELKPHSSILRAIAQQKVGGVILFDVDVPTKGARNIVSLEQVSRLCASLQKASPQKLLIAIDQEGGKVQRIKPVHGLPQHPSHLALGKCFPDSTRAVAFVMGQELATLGINFNLAPCVDIHNPKSPAIGALQRSFSADPELVAQHAKAFTEGMEKAGVLTCLKHFPGHGSALHDTHEGLADVSSSWDERELLPYQRLLEQGWHGAILTAHVRNTHWDTYPASLSPAVNTTLLRGKMGFTGVIITDDLQMKAVAAAYPLEKRILLAVNAGADILLFGNNLSWDADIVDKAHSTLVRLVKSGQISEDRLYQSWVRIIQLKDRLP